MSDGPNILTLDIATTTGFAHGAAGGKIYSGSFRAGAPGAPNHEVGRAYGVWLCDLIEAVRPIGVYAEAANFQYMAGRTNKDTIIRLCGMIYDTQWIASKFGIYKVHEVTTKDFRNSFLGKSPARKEAKSMMIKRCRALGHDVRDDNEADAIGIHYHVSSTLFSRVER